MTAGKIRPIFCFFSYLPPDYYFCTSGPVIRSLARDGEKTISFEYFCSFGGGLFVVVLMLDSTCARQHLDARLCSWSNLDEWLTCAGHPHAVAAREPHKCPSTLDTQHLTHFFSFFFAGGLIIHLAWIFNRKSFSPFGAGNSKILKIIVSRGGNLVISRSNFRISFTWRPFFLFSSFSPLEVVTTTERPIDHYSRRFYFPTALKKIKKKKEKLRLVMRNEWNSRQADDGRGHWDVRRASNNCRQTFFFSSWQSQSVPPPVVWFSGHLFHDPFSFQSSSNFPTL
jgi:hypothetical protein